jgi:hypothetical protein
VFSVIVLVGPGDHEVERLSDTLDSLRAHAGAGPFRLILTDDGPQPRRLERLWPGASILRTALWERHRPDPVSARTAGLIEALRRAEGDFALKLDTDAVVIAPFAEWIQSTLRGDPSIGIVGAYDVAAAGGQRDWSMWPAVIRRTTWWIRAVRPPGRLPQITIPSREALTANRAVVRAASANPSYSLGAHCLGGAYAVSRSLLARRDLLDWRPWIRTQLEEDVLLGLLSGAAGLRMLGAVGAGEPFAVSWKGLPAEPARLLARGHSIVHSVKDGAHGTESQLRAWFRHNAR